MYSSIRHTAGGVMEPVFYALVPISLCLRAAWGTQTVGRGVNFLMLTKRTPSYQRMFPGTEMK